MSSNNKTSHKDLTGQRFNKLLVIRMEKRGSLYHAICQCDCGKIKSFIPINLRKNMTGSCGCIPRARKPPINSLVGKEFGFLVVVAMEQAAVSKTGKASGMYYAICKCLRCGNSRHAVVPNALKTGRTTSCGCRRDQYLQNTGKNNVAFKGYEEIRAKLWQHYKKGASTRNLEFTISMEYAWSVYIKQDRKCALTEVPLVFGSTIKSSNTNASIDRIDNSKGYIEGNIQWVHKTINRMRNKFSIDEFVHWCCLVARHSI